MDFADNECVPCRGGIPPMERARAEEMLKQLDRGWALNRDGHLERRYTFKDFAQALAFVNKVGAVAEEEGHHPRIDQVVGITAVPGLDDELPRELVVLEVDVVEADRLDELVPEVLVPDGLLLLGSHESLPEAVPGLAQERPWLHRREMT